MTAEQVFQWYRGYKFFYEDKYDFKKYNWNPPPAPPLIRQRDRQFYYRIAQKMTDVQIHALFSRTFFFDPKAYVSTMVSPDAQSAALAFASRAENGEILIQHDLYALKKRLAGEDLQSWLYGIEDDGKTQLMMPGVLQDVISKELPLDIACILLLVPVPALSYHWKTHFVGLPDMGLGPNAWIARLYQLDAILNHQRTGWRMFAHRIAGDFWSSLNVPSLAPVKHTVPSLF